MAILVCGGAGYIGSHMVAELIENNKEVVILDNFEKGHEDAILGGKLYKGDLRDRKILDKIFTENNIEAVIDFAAYSLVGESMTEPLKYFNNNVSGTISLLEAMRDHNVKYIVFSSTAATYGEPENIPILETDKNLPTNAYGESKLLVEKILKWCDTAYGIKYTALRYFNAAGAHVNGKIGEDHAPETHLIPLILQVALGKRDKIMMFGDDYDTVDGTGVRDYIHVLDLSHGHVKALEKLSENPGLVTYNLGTGKGYSVLELVNAFSKASGKEIPYKITERRPGDIAACYADPTKAEKELGWKAKYGIDEMCEDSWRWQSQNPNGYKK